MNESEKHNQRVDSILRRVRRKALWFVVFGLGFYAGGCVIIDWFVPEQAERWVWTSRLFSAIIIYWGAVEIWPCMRGAFEVGLDSHRTMTPVMQDLSGVAKDFRRTVDKYAEDGDLVKGVFKELTTEVKKMREDMKRNMGENFKWTPPDPASLPDPLLSGGNGKGVDPKAETRVLPAVRPADVCSLDESQVPEGT